MTIEATNRTAAMAGVWCSIGIVPFEVWSDHTKFTSILAYNFVWLLAFLVFLVVPLIYFVIGRSTGPFGPTWMLDPGERARYRVCAKRMVVWFASAAGAGILISIPSGILFS